MKTNSFLRLVKKPKFILLKLAQKSSFPLSDELFYELCYEYILGSKLDLSNPKEFAEKLQWLKLHDRKPIYTTMVDKYEGKEYIARKIGKEHVIPTLGKWGKFKDINFDKLPEKFVLKTTHDSGGVVICTDKSKFDYKAAEKKLNKSLKTNYYRMWREWPYKNVKKMIIAEEFLEPEGGSLIEYKFMCFNGKVEYIFVITGKNEKKGTHITVYSRDWKRENFHRDDYPAEDIDFKKPEQLSEMIKIAEKFSREIKFLRVDMYNIKGRIYIGELTLYPTAGFARFEPKEYNMILGDMIDLNTKKK